MDRENTRDHHSRKEYRKNYRRRDRNSKYRKRVLDGVEKSWHMPDKKENQWSACPKQVIKNEIARFSDFFSEGNAWSREKFWDDILYISTSPGPSSQLFVLRAHGTQECSFIHEIHLANSGRVYDAKHSIKSKICAPVLETILYERSFRPVFCLMQAV